MEYNLQSAACMSAPCRRAGSFRLGEARPQASPSRRPKMTDTLMGFDRSTAWLGAARSASSAANASRIARPQRSASGIRPWPNRLICSSTVRPRISPLPRRLLVRPPHADSGVPCRTAVALQGRPSGAAHRAVFHGYWKWSQGVQDEAAIRDVIYSRFGWPMRVVSGFNPRSIRNLHPPRRHRTAGWSASTSAVSPSATRTTAATAGSGCVR
jgi:hypothetical protein